MSHVLSAPDPKGNGSSAQEIPCVRRCRNRTVPALIRLPPSGDTIGSRFYRTKRLLQSSFRSHSAARHSWLAAKHSRFVRTAQQVGAECVVTRCRVSGNPLPVLHQKEDLRNHGFLSAFFVSFVARQKTPARGRNNPSCPTGQNSTSTQTTICWDEKTPGSFRCPALCFIRWCSCRSSPGYRRRECPCHRSRRSGRTESRSGRLGGGEWYLRIPSDRTGRRPFR